MSDLFKINYIQLQNKINDGNVGTAKSHFASCWNSNSRLASLHEIVTFFLLKLCFSQVEHLPALGHAVGEAEQGRHDDQEPLTTPQ
jgi:hypothetical protein